MNNVDYFLKACEAGAYRHREWVQSVFMITSLPLLTAELPNRDHYPGRLYSANGYVGYVTGDFDKSIDNDDVSPENIEMTLITFNGKPIEVQSRKEPLLLVNETIKITPNDVVSLQKPVLETTPGTVFVNYYCFIDSIGDRHPFVEGPNISVGKVAQQISSHVVDDPKEGEEVDLDKIYVKDFKRMLSAMASLSGFTIVNSPSATEYTVQAAPGIQELKAKLLEENKDKLHDPATIIQIEKELIKKDKEYINQDPYKGFYIKGKSFNVSRKKLHIMQGLQARMDPDKPAQLITTSLYEPSKQEDIPALIDGLREGSYSRGAATALGGEAVKFVYRVYSAAEIIKEDCGTRLGIPRVIGQDNKPSAFIGTYIIDGNKDILITEENLKDFIGKKVLTRSPGFCKADIGGRGYCLRCFGEKMRGYEQSLASYGAAVTSTMNTRFMKKMHGTSGDTNKLHLDSAIS